MAVSVATSTLIAVDGLYASAYSKSVKCGISAPLKVWTNHASGGYEQWASGLGIGVLEMSGNQDFATNGPLSVVSPLTMGTLRTFTVAYPGLTAGDAAVVGQGYNFQVESPVGGQVGELGSFSAQFSSSGKVAEGKLLHPRFARTATGSGTAVTFTPPTASQTLYASFHVHEVAGAGTITFTVQTDDNSGMTTPTTRITSSAFAAVGGGFGSLAGALAGETHIRTGYTISGFTSVTFSVAFGVA
jgi:hypothetical protein